MCRRPDRAARNGSHRVWVSLTRTPSRVAPQRLTERRPLLLRRSVSQRSWRRTPLTITADVTRTVAAAEARLDALARDVTELVAVEARLLAERRRLLLTWL